MSDRFPQSIKISQIIESQIPEYFLESDQGLVDFLKQYYISQEYQGGPINILENIDVYNRPNTFTNVNLIENTTLSSNITAFSQTIEVDSTFGWPKSYGLLKIDDEIITYTGITSTSFTGCIRGFCGVESLNEYGDPDSFVFLDTVAKKHTSGSEVLNLSNLFLRKFYESLKYQYAPGFENVGVSTELDTQNLFQYAKDFYRTKGTERSFKILFDILFGVEVSFTKPADFLFTPSDGQWVENQFLIVEDLTGDIRKIQKGTEFTQLPNSNTDGATAVLYYSTDIPERDNKFFSKIGFDRETVRGVFFNTSYSKILEPVNVGETIISLDSTVGFPETGSIAIKTNTGLQYITYTSKTLTQLIGCVGLGSTTTIGQSIAKGTTVYEDNLLTGEIDGKQNYFAITNVLSSFKNNKTRYLYPGDKVNIKSFGYENNSDPIFTSWIYNIKNTYRVNGYKILSSSLVEFELDNTKNLKLNDKVEIYVNKTVIDTGSVTLVGSKVNITVNSSLISGSNSKNLKLIRILSKPSSFIYDGVNQYVSGVQNTYTDESSAFVSSSSLPNNEIDIKSGQKTFSKSNVSNKTHYVTISSHNFYSGQLVYYKKASSGTSILPFDEGRVYIKRIDSDRIAFAYNLVNVDEGKIIEIVSDAITAQTHEIYPEPTYGKKLTSQNLLKSFPLVPKRKNNTAEITDVNTSVGLFVNGVEIIHARSNNFISYGKVESIEVKKSLDNFDVINSPKLLITDNVGSGAEGIVQLSGSISEVIIENEGFRFLGEPVSDIIGGNGSGAVLETNVIIDNSDYVKTFNNAGINTDSDIITFSTKHDFINGDSVIYDELDQTPPEVIRVGLGSTGETITTESNLSDTEIYYVGVVSERSIKLFYTQNDAFVGLNTVDFVSIGGTGNQSLRLNEVITKISSINVVDGGSNYQNRKIHVLSQTYPPQDYLETNNVFSGISVENDYIFAKNHGFSTGDLVEYSILGTGTSISGLSTSSSYYIVKIDKNKFHLTNVSISTSLVVNLDITGISTIVTNEVTTKFLDQNKIIKFDSVGVGTHVFKYPDIRVRTQGFTSIGYTSVYQKAICLGKIDNVYLTKGGSSYGSEDTLNYERDPKVTVTTGSGGVIKPIVSEEGKIVDIIIQNKGRNYVTPPNLIVEGSGVDAQLTANIVDEKISSVNIINAGTGYSSYNTTVRVVSVGSSIGVSLKPNIQKWFVDNFEFHKSNYTNNNEGAIIPTGNDNYGNRYINFTLNRDLRYKLGDNITNNFEENLTNHSPIVGWAYDGNPIYGPYGYTSSTDITSVKRLESGYKKITKSNRPSTVTYPLGFFYDDYIFTNTGDLDENNGRFCVTPEFPNGSYAYFSTLSDTFGFGSFNNNKLPEFPYVVGKSFNNSIDLNNLRNFYSESDLDSPNTNLSKNVSPYNLNSYEFLDLNFIPKDNIFEIKSIFKKNNIIDDIKIVNPGSNYKVGDTLVFDNFKTGGDGAQAFVNSIVGKGVTSVNITTKTFKNVKLEYNPPIITGFTTIPHDFENGDIISIQNVRSDDSEPENDTTDSKFFKNILGIRTLSISTATSGLSTDIPSYSTTDAAGFTTFIGLNEKVDLVEKFQIDGIVGIKSEYMKILNIDDLNNRLRVLRGYNPENPNNPSLSGIAYTTGDILEVKTNKFKFTVPLLRGTKAPLLTKSFYFDPTTSVGLGTTGSYLSYEVGIGSTLNQSIRFVDTQRIYVKDHGLKTGDKLLYSPGVGIALSFSTNSNLTNSVSLGSTVFAVFKGKDFIGLSTNRVGLGGTTNTGVYFTGIGSGTSHVLTTDFGETLLCDLIRQYATVSVGETHGLSKGDSVTLSVIPNEIITQKLVYNETIGKLCVGVATVLSSEIGIGTTSSSFAISNHGLYNGDRIFYQSSDPALPLKNNEQYYVIKVDDNIIRLSENEYDVKYDYSYVELTSAGSGIHTLSPINPQIKIVKGNTLRLNLSDTSLKNFDLVLFYDNQFLNQFVGTGTYFSSSSFESSLSGTPGFSDSYFEIYTKYRVPKNLFYSLKLKNIDSPTNSTKLKFNIDNSVSNYSKIRVVNSKFNVSGTAFDIFDDKNFYLQLYPTDIKEPTGYGITNTNSMSYTTTSTTASGNINSIKIEFGGFGYESIPSIEDVVSDQGIGAQLLTSSNNIGRSNRHIVFRSTYSIPSDFTINPKLEFPISLKIEDNYTIKGVSVNKKYRGKNYLEPPTIIALDNANQIINNLIFEATVDSGHISNVSIIQNATGLKNDIKLVSTNNSNGYDIDTVSFNTSTKIVTLTLNTNLPTNKFVFNTGQKIFVEGLTSYSGILTTSGYNSSDHSYELFEIVGVNTSSRTISYQIDSDSPGNIDEENSSGYVILESDLVILTPRFVRGNFKNDENVIVTKPDNSQTIFRVASVNGWDGKTLKLFYKNKNTQTTIDINDKVEGVISKQKGTVNDVNISTADAVVSPFYNAPIGWEKENGKLNVSNQKIQDSDYYQKLSYDIKSTLSPSLWKETVDSLNHVAGQKSFASSIIISEPS